MNEKGITKYKISVLIPVYNVEKYVERCINSVLSQTMQEGVEVIIVNDDTPDKSMEIISEILRSYNVYSKEKKMTVRVICHETNRSLAAARNTAVSHATGEYVIHVDSDDWIESDMLEKMYKKAVETKADIVICDWNEIYANKLKHVQVNPPLHNKDCVVALFSGTMFGFVWNKLIKRELYKSHEIMCQEGMDFCEDLYVIYRLFYFAEAIAYVNFPLYNYNKQNLNSYTSTALSIKSQKGLVALTKEIDAFFQIHETNAEIKKAIDYFFNSVKSTILLKGDCMMVRQIKETSILSILSHPLLPIHYKIILICYQIKFNLGVKVIRYIYQKSIC